MTGTGGTGTCRAELIGDARHGALSQPAATVGMVELDGVPDAAGPDGVVLADDGELGDGLDVAHDEAAASTTARIAVPRTVTALRIPAARALRTIDIAPP
jgi:hypothetical protein